MSVNIKTDLVFLPEHEEAEVCSVVIARGSEILGASRKIDRYKASLREVFGLLILTAHRRCLQPDRKWVFSTEPELSDDGLIVDLGEGNRARYLEKVEQLYLPGRFLASERQKGQSMNDFILERIRTTKHKGWEYQKDTSLLVLSDVRSESPTDCFEWKEFAKGFYDSERFLHLYFVSLVEHQPQRNEYYLFSFTNQKHRQELNGEFRFAVTPDGISGLERTQEINLLKPRGAI